MKTLIGRILAATLLLSPVAFASTDALSDGTVKKVDAVAGKLKIAHGPLANLGMGPMTMVFTVADPAMVEQVKKDDRIRFVAEDRGGVLTVTHLELAQ